MRRINAYVSGTHIEGERLIVHYRPLSEASSDEVLEKIYDLQSKRSAILIKEGRTVELPVPRRYFKKFQI
jgi:hypothetical protein